MFSKMVSLNALKGDLTIEKGVTRLLKELIFYLKNY